MYYKNGIFGQMRDAQAPAGDGHTPASPTSGGSRSPFPLTRVPQVRMLREDLRPGEAGSGGQWAGPLISDQGLPAPVNGGAGLPECPAGTAPLPDGTCYPLPNGEGPPPNGGVLPPPDVGWWASQPTEIKIVLGVGGVAVVGMIIYLAVG
jgi:hypothetical protein